MTDLMAVGFQSCTMEIKKDGQALLWGHLGDYFLRGRSQDSVGDYSTRMKEGDFMRPVNAAN